MGRLTFIGIGIYDERDITLKGLDAVQDADKVFAEFYTSKMGVPMEKLELRYDKNIILLTREQVEDGRIILDAAEHMDVAFIVGGDALSATTHTSLRLDAVKRGIHVDIVHGPSILTAAASLLGLQHYKFGRTTTLPFPTEGYKPTSPYNVIAENQERGLHTLILLDIGMTANDAIRYLKEVEESGDGGKGLFSDDKKLCVVARAGSPRPGLHYVHVEDAPDVDFGAPLHTLIYPGELHFMEEEALEAFCNR